MWDEEELFSSLEGGIDLSEAYHLKQRALSEDPSNFRVVIGGRRSGKTTLIGSEALEVADQFPGLTVPYVCYTVSRARDILMPQMRKFEQEGLKLTYNLGDHKIFTPNGGCIQMFGLATTAEVEKGRGGSYPALYIDEAGACNQQLLKRAVLETFGPATKDFFGIGGRGILVGGTPNYVPGTYWEKLCGSNTHVSEFGASVHHMTIWDNPFYAGREEAVVHQYCLENKLTRDSSPVLREWEGKFCIDSDGLAYPGWSNKVLPRHTIPLGGYTVLGVDFGNDHPCAWVVIRFIITEQIIGDMVRYIHHGHILETYEETGLSIHDVAAITRTFQQRYNVSGNCTFGDSGGNSMTVDTLSGTMGLDIQPVKKVGHKQDRIWYMDSMLRNGTLHVHEDCQTLIDQLGSVPVEVKPNGLRDHMTGYHDHSLDAAHYALLAAEQHTIDVNLPPAQGTREYREQQNAEVIEMASIHPMAQQRERLADRMRRRKN
jgi:hypothetical protein